MFKAFLVANIGFGLFMVGTAFFLNGRFIFEAATGAILSLLIAAGLVYKNRSNPNFVARQKYLFKTIFAFAVLGWTSFFLFPEAFVIAN